MPKRDIKDFSIDGLKEVMSGLGLERYRARQMLKWLYQSGVKSFDEMTNFKKELRERLAGQYHIGRLELVREQASSDGCVKSLLKLQDDNLIESVVIPDDGRNTLCVSSQVGCKMGCRFCLTARLGYIRNLTAGEILNQVLFARECVSPERITNIVFMGMGEPLLNLDNVVGAIDILKDDDAFGMSYRRLTVSTCGVAPKLKELCNRTEAMIAVSLNATDDETRSQIMPVNKKYPINELIKTCRELPMKKRARITFEYVLIKGVNDSLDDAKRLARLLTGLKCKINLIPFNECPGLKFKTPSEDAVVKFQTCLLNKNFTTILRTSRGQDICAACGQLRGKLVV